MKGRTSVWAKLRRNEPEADDVEELGGELDGDIDGAEGIVLDGEAFGVGRADEAVVVADLGAGTSDFHL